MGNFEDFQKLKSFKKAKRMLLQGASGLSVAKYIQSQGEFTHIAADSLRATVLAHRRRLTTMEKIAATRPREFQEAVEELDNGLDELAEMAEIFGIQKNRILMGHSLEKKLKILNKALGNEVRIAAELLRTSHQIKKDLGATTNVVNDLSPISRIDRSTLVQQHGTSPTEVMLDPNKRNRVLAVISAAMNKAKTVDEDGDVIRIASGGSR